MKNIEIEYLSKCEIILNICGNYYFSIIIQVNIRIRDFSALYKESFPRANFFPKLHMLEKHVVPWIKKWKVGFGLIGEQGAESIHAYFNQLKRT